MHFFFPSGKRWVRVLVDYSCTPGSDFPPIVPVAFLSPRSLSSSMPFLFHVLVPTAGLPACLCPRFPGGDGMWPCYHPFMLQTASSVPETSSGCWQDSSTVAAQLDCHLAFPRPAWAVGLLPGVRCLSVHLRAPWRDVQGGAGLLRALGLCAVCLITRQRLYTETRNQRQRQQDSGLGVLS